MNLLKKIQPNTTSKDQVTFNTTDEYIEFDANLGLSHGCEVIADAVVDIGVDVAVDSIVDGNSDDDKDKDKDKN